MKKWYGQQERNQLSSRVSMICNITSARECHSWNGKKCDRFINGSIQFHILCVCERRRFFSALLQSCCTIHAVLELFLLLFYELFSEWRNHFDYIELAIHTLTLDSFTVIVCNFLEFGCDRSSHRLDNSMCCFSISFRFIFFCFLLFLLFACNSTYCSPSTHFACGATERLRPKRWLCASG